MATCKNSKKTEANGLSRREVILKLAILAASAAGLGSSKVAQPPQTKLKNLKDLIPIRASTFNAKAIKVLIFGDPEVYKMEFGRPWVEPMLPDPSCPIHIGGWGGFGSECGQLRLCNANSCGTQSCPNLSSCVNNSCDKQLRSKSYKGTTLNPFDPLIIEKIKNDPFIKELYRVLGAKSSQELSNMLHSLIKR